MHALEGLCAGGATNLGEGLLWGLGELASSDAPAAAMLLFTDGLANRGMTKTDDLLEAMQGPMADMGRQSRAVFSFGLGTDHNAQMLFALADAGTGCYYYVDTAMAIAPSFADCLGGMLSVAAQDVSLTLHTQQGVTIKSVNADFNVELSNDCTEAHIKMRDLSSDAEKEVLFSLAVPALQSDTEHVSLLTCTLSYLDVADGCAKRQEDSLRVRSLKYGKSETGLDAVVEAHRCRLLAATAMEQAAAKMNKATLFEVQNILSDTLHALEQSPARACTKVQERIDTLIKDVSQCLECASDPRSCEKLCSSRAFAHKHQISTRAEGSDYRNALQKSLADAARLDMCLAIEPETRLGTTRGRRTASARVARASHAACNGNEAMPSSADTMPAGAVRVGMRMVCHGRAG